MSPKPLDIEAWFGPKEMAYGESNGHVNDDRVSQLAGDVTVSYLYQVRTGQLTGEGATKSTTAAAAVGALHQFAVVNYCRIQRDDGHTLWLFPSILRETVWSTVCQ